MQIYSGGDWRDSSFTWLKAVGLGQLRSVPHWQPPRKGLPWVLDNGAFTLYRRGTGERYDTAMGKRFTWLLQRIDAGMYHMPDFVILPDIVARSQSSLDLSLRWINRFPRDVPPYLAVQNGMGPKRIAQILKHERRIKGLFVGGTIDWKDNSAPLWNYMAHRMGLKCHVGRVGTAPRIARMLEIGVDSIDSSSWAQHYSHHHIENGFEMYAERTGTVPAALRRMRKLSTPEPPGEVV